MHDVSLALICKNEIANIKGLLEDVCGLVEVIVVDTGSTDGTLEVLKEYQTRNLIRLEHFTWVDDFSAARNFAFSLATKSWVGWLDADDRLDRKAFEGFLSQIEQPGVDCWLLDYHYASNADGSPAVSLARERFLRRALSPKWCGAIHEAIDISRFRTRHYPKLKVIHNRKGKKLEAGRNIRILAKEFEKNPKDPRTAYYYGKELFDEVNPKGIEVLEHFLSLGPSYYDDMVNAHFRLGKHYLSVRDHGKAVHHAERIYHIDHSRERAEAYWLWGSVERDLKNLRAACRWFEMCLQCNPEPPRVVSREYYSWNPRKQLAECYAALCQSELAREHAEAVLGILKGDAAIEAWAKKLLEGLPKVVTRDPSPNDVQLFFGRVEESKDPEVELWRALKEGRALGGFFLSDEPVEGANFLGEFDGRKGYRKHDPLKPTLGYRAIPGALDFGPYRIRIENLMQSARVAGYPVVDTSRDSTAPVDILVSSRLSAQDRAKIRVLDICEELPDYRPYGLEYADVLCAASNRLAEHLRALGKPVFVCADHAEPVFA